MTSRRLEAHRLRVDSPLMLAIVSGLLREMRFAIPGLVLDRHHCGTTDLSHGMWMIEGGRSHQRGS